MARSMGPAVTTVNELLDGHTVLDLSCLDRLYLSGFVQGLQTPGGVVYFLHEVRGLPIASPAVFEQIGTRFRDGMRRYAQANHIPLIPLRGADRKVDVMRPYLDRAARAGRSQVAAIGVAQEFQVVWTARKRDTEPTKSPQFSFTKQQRRVTVFYVYLLAIPWNRRHFRCSDLAFFDLGRVSRVSGGRPCACPRLTAPRGRRGSRVQGRPRAGRAATR